MATTPSIKRTVAFAPSPGTVEAAALDAPSSATAAKLSREPADRRFVRAVMIDLAGRSPLEVEWTAANGKPRGEWVHMVARSIAAAESFYEEELFYFLLIDNFRPSTDAFIEIPQMLVEHKISTREMLRQIVSSQFFNSRNPGNDTFVTVVLEQLLGFTVQKEPAVLDAGKRMYDGYTANFLGKSGSSQADLVRIAVEHLSLESCFLSRRFTSIFVDDPPKKRLAADAARLRADPLAWSEIVAGWINSQAYDERLAKPRPKSDRVFVRSLYADLFGRVPDYQEFRRCRNALLALSDSRPLRSVLIKLMLDSDAADALAAAAVDRNGYVRERFLQFLGREPTQGESSAFVRELGDGANPKLLLRALLTHSEYQSY
ncbi:MAG: hypothetical protein EXS13_08330 [Planctomycetes bacterium]|nr:hypothetical protein [Planctomycetota bacterium]